MASVKKHRDYFIGPRNFVHPYELFIFNFIVLPRVVVGFMKAHNHEIVVGKFGNILIKLWLYPIYICILVEVLKNVPPKHPQNLCKKQFFVL